MPLGGGAWAWRAAGSGKGTRGLVDTACCGACRASLTRSRPPLYGTPSIARLGVCGIPASWRPRVGHTHCALPGPHPTPPPPPPPASSCPFPGPQHTHCHHHHHHRTEYLRQNYGAEHPATVLGWFREESKLAAVLLDDLGLEAIIKVRGAGRGVYEVWGMG